MQIFNSSFGGNKFEGNGGVIFLKGTDLCKVNVSNSAFVNTSASQGGALDIECVEVRFHLLESIFLRNNATNGSGGAVLIIGYRASVWFLNSSFTKSVAKGEAKGHEVYGGGALFVSSELPAVHSSAFQARHLDGAIFSVTVERCRFISCRSVDGGSLCVGYFNHDQRQLVIKHSEFIFNYAYRYGAAVATRRRLIGAMTDDCRTRNTHIFEISIENSTFSRNEAADGSALFVADDEFFYHGHSVATFEKVIMDSNIAWDRDTVVIWDACKLKISRSRFLNNKAAQAGGIALVGVISTQVANSIFDGNYGGANGIDSGVSGGALALENASKDNRCNVSALLWIVNSTFNNCSGPRGGAISLLSWAPLHVAVKSSRFTKNHSFKYGGATWLSLTEDTKKYPAKCKGDYRPSWRYKSHVIFEDTTFEGNIAAKVGGAVYITNGNVTLSKSHFVDNFASLGSHVYTVDGSTSLKIKDCCFSLTQNKSNRSAQHRESLAFIYFGSGGPIVLSNTTLNASPYSNKITLIVVAKSSLTFLGKDNLTSFSCPSGSKMTNTNFTTKIRSQLSSSRNVQIITQYIRYDCLACTSGTYSLLRGHAIEGQIDPGFQCFQCPFGANCTRNIVAKPNFWAMVCYMSYGLL